jgi:phosphoglycerate dehydrogenase-like enzyme
MRVLTQLPARYTTVLRERLPDIEFVEVPMTGPAPHEPAEVLFTWTRGSKNMGDVLDEHVKWVHTLGTGVDEFDFSVIGDRLLTCARGAAGVPIAEWVLAMMLAFEKDLPNQWVTQPPEQFLWGSLGTLARRKLALVGFGSIGQQVARHAIGFEMDVHALRRTQSPSPVDGVNVVSSLAEVLADADHVVLAAPLTPATHGMIDASAFAQMKEGVHIVNIARGGLIDQDALRVALDAGTVGCASLDTTEPEPLPEGHWLYEHERVRLSPHVSWSSPTAEARTLAAFETNLERWIRGEPLDGVVNVGEGY